MISAAIEPSGTHDLAGDIRDEMKAAHTALLRDTMGHMMHRWAVVDGMQLHAQDADSIKKYYFCADHGVGRFKENDDRIATLMETLPEGSQTSQVWTYIEIDGRKQIRLTEAMKSNPELRKQHSHPTRRPARVLVARGVVVTGKLNNSGRGKTYFGEIALGLMNRTAEPQGFDFTYVLGARLKYDTQERFYSENSMSESEWVSRAATVRFRGIGVDVVQGELE